MDKTKESLLHDIDLDRLGQAEGSTLATAGAAGLAGSALGLAATGFHDMATWRRQRLG